MTQRDRVGESNKRNNDVIYETIFLQKIDETKH